MYDQVHFLRLATDVISAFRTAELDLSGFSQELGRLFRKVSQAKVSTFRGRPAVYISAAIGGRHQDVPWLSDGQKASVQRVAAKHGLTFLDEEPVEKGWSSLYFKAASGKLARVTQEQIRLKYVNLGDFGGTDPVVDSYILEVKGPYEAMQSLLPVLKKYKFRWDAGSRSWTIHAVNYAYSNRKRDNFWAAARRNQKAAYPILKKLVEKYNLEVYEANKALGPGGGKKMTVKDLMNRARSKERLTQRLGGYGIRVEFEWPNKYSVDEAKTWVLGDTYAVKDVMKKHGFRWGSGPKGKGWWIPAVEYIVVADKWVPDVMRALPAPAGDPTGKAVFSEMSRSELFKFVKTVIPRDMEFNEGYDGEVSEDELMRDYMKALPAMKPHEQDQAMANWKSGLLPHPGRPGSSGGPGHRRRNAEEYDHFRDKHLERGTWDSYKRRTRGPARTRPEPVKNPYKSYDLRPDKVVLPEFHERTFHHEGPVTLTFRGRVTEKGLIRVEAVMPYNGNSMTPPLPPAAEKLAKRVKHFRYRKVSGGTAMSIQGWYKLPDAIVTKWDSEAKSVSKDSAAMADFKKILSTHLKP
jgi:hypothetical protein